MILPESQLPEQAGTVGPSLGQRLRERRLARGMSVADVAGGLRAPQSLVDAIERDDHERLGAAVYARGYLSSYARLVDVPESAVEQALASRETVEAPLQPPAHVSNARYMLDRYARRGAYLVLTASIVLPVLWFKDQLAVQQLGLKSLDTPVETALREVDEVAGRPLPGAIASPVSPVQPADGDDMTVVASLAPFYAPPSVVAEAPAEAAAAEPMVADALAPTPGAGAGWQLSVSRDSWVEVLAADGRRLEYGLLRAGSVRAYPAGAVSAFALGNADGIELSRDGESVDLTPYRRANVARFTVSSDGRLSPSGS